MAYDPQYVTAEEVRAVDTSISSGEDTFLDTLIDGVQGDIEQWAGTVFKYDTGGAVTTKYMDWCNGETIFFSTWLHDLDKIYYEAWWDSENGYVESADAEVYLLGVGPYYGVKIYELGLGKRGREQGRFKITGHWAYSTVPGENIKRAVIRLVLNRYRNRREFTDEVPDWVWDTINEYTRGMYPGVAL